jgi:hypothetical protein
MKMMRCMLDGMDADDMLQQISEPMNYKRL